MFFFWTQCMPSFEDILFAYIAVWARSCPCFEWQLTYPTVNMECSLYKNLNWRICLTCIMCYIFMSTLPVNYALDLRKLSFLQKQSVCHISVMNLLFSLTASKEFELLCKYYSVIQPQAHGRFRACVWHCGKSFSQLFSRSEVIVRTNTLTNKQTPLKTSTSLRYATPVGNKKSIQPVNASNLYTC